MKKLLLLIFLCASFAQAQTVHTVPNEDTPNAFTADNTFSANLFTKLVNYTVGGLPAPSSQMTGLIVVVTDGLSAADCLTGGGSTAALCRNSGSAWVSIGGGGGGGGTPGTPLNCLQYNSGSAFAGTPGICTADGNSLPIKGPDPSRDLGAYMPVGGCSFPGITSLGATGTISASASILTVSSSADWNNGCGITIPHAGATSTIVMPTCPTVSTATRTSNVVTIVCSANTNLVYTGTGGANGEDQAVTMSSCSDSSMNGTYILASNNATTNFTYKSSGSNGTSTGCTVSFYQGFTHGATGAATVYYKIAPVDTQGGMSAAVGPITITNAPGTAGTGSASDNFNRSNGGLGANWTTISGFTAPTITSDEVQGNTAVTHQASAYTGTSFTGNLTVTITYGGTSTASDPGAEVSSLLTDGSGHGYVCAAYDGTINLVKYSSSTVFVGLATPVSDHLVNGDTLSIIQSGNGTSYTCEHNSTILTATAASDTTYTVTAPGLDLYGNTSNSIITNFTATGTSQLGISVQNNNMNFITLFWPYTVGNRMTAVWRSTDGTNYACVGMAFSLSYQDWGFNAPCPAFVPITPPAAPTAQNLTTTISSGGGTTTLHLAAAATTSVTSGPVFHDEMPFLDACVNDANADQLNVHGYSPGSVGCVIPAGVYHFNSDFTTDRISPSYGGMLIQVAGTPYLETWPWIIGKSNYAIQGIGFSGAQQNASYWPTTSVLATNVPAAFVIHASAVEVNHFSMLGLNGFGIYAGLSPSGLGGPSGVSLNQILISNSTHAAGIPLMIGGNEFEINSTEMNLFPRPDGMPCSVLFTTDTYQGIGGADNTFNTLQLEWHHFCTNAPGGQQGQGFSWNVNTMWSEEHGQYPTGGFVTIDTGDSVYTGSTVNSIGLTAMQNADASNKILVGVIGTNSTSTSIGVAADSFAPLIACFNSISTSCSRGLVSLTMSNASSENPYNGKAQVGPFASASNYLIGFPLTLTSGQGMWGNTPPSPVLADALPATSNTTVTGTSSGSLAAGTYCMKMVGLDFQGTPGTTLPGPEVCSTVGASSDIVLQWQNPTFNSYMYSDWRLYYNFNGGGYSNYIDTSVGPNSSFTLGYTFTSTSGAVSASIPTTPTAYMSWLYRDTGKNGCIYCTGTAGGTWALGIGEPTVPSGSKLAVKGGLINAESGLKTTTEEVTTSVQMDNASAPAGVSSAVTSTSVSGWPQFNPNAAGARSECGSTGSVTSGHIVAFNSSGTNCDLVDGGTGTGSGTVTNFTVAADPLPLFTTSVATSGTTPALTFTLANAAAHKAFMNNTGSSAAPAFQSIGAADLPATVVNSITNDTNIQGSITAQVLTLAWASTLAVARGGSGAATFAAHGVLLGEGTSAFVSKVPSGNAQCFMSAASSGTTTDPSFQSCPTGVTLQTNTVNNTSQTTLNVVNTAGSTGITASNPSGGILNLAIANPSGTGNSVVIDTQTSFAQGNYLCADATPKWINCQPTVTPNEQTGTSYTIASTDALSLLTFTNSSATAIPVPTSFGTGFSFAARNNGTGAVTYTPSSGTICGGSTYVQMDGQQANFVFDGTNYICTTSGYGFGTTGSITGTALTATCDSGTATVNGAVAGQPVVVSTTDGTDVGGAFYLRGSVTASNTVTVYVCGTGTPSSKAYNVRVLP